MPRGGLYLEVVALPEIEMERTALPLQNWPADQMALCTNTMHKLVDNLRGSLDHTPLDWAKMPNPFRHYEACRS
jgi:hypothetical protein